MLEVKHEMYLNNTVAHSLKARTVEAEEQSLLCNGLYTRSRGTRHVGYDFTQQ
jgi:hypothetical protein